MIRNLLKSGGLLFALALQLPAAEILKLYSHGNPTADEQYMLELINRARANPPAEGRFLAGFKDPAIKVGLDYYHVDLARLQQDFNSYPVRPPLAFNVNLLKASDRHSTDMAKHNFQDHTGSDGSTIASRFADAGYKSVAANESIYSILVSTPLFCHVGLNIDWGPYLLGIQPGLGHRKNIMGFGTVDCREVGIGIATRTGTDAEKKGKLAVTQDFGTRADSPNFLVGVAYYDVNGNGICDPGEGLADIKVIPAAGSYYAKTSLSGGYAIPFPPEIRRSSMTFSGGGLKSPVSQDLVFSGENVKVDLRITSGAPFVALKVVDGIASEKGKAADDDALFRITRVGPLTEDLKILLTRPIIVTTGNAKPGDYKVSAVAPALISKIDAPTGNFNVTIPKGKSYADVKIKAVKDSLAEPIEKVVFTLRDSVAYRSSSKQASISIK
jgi:hypothetical protein